MSDPYSFSRSESMGDHVYLEIYKFEKTDFDFTL